jgi:hypothetical protein
MSGLITQDVPENNLPAVISDQPTTTSALMQLAIQRMDGSNAASMVDVLERLVGLQERMEERNAVKAFHKAMAEFQAECPQILKDSHAKIRTKSGAEYGYKYAELDQIDDAIRPLMTRLGLSKRFTTEKIGGEVKVTCIVSHMDGHSISSDFQCALDTEAAMSGPQKGGAAVTFAKRYALIAALGLTTTETDTDAQQKIDRKPEKINSEQAANLSALLDEVYGADSGARAKFFQFFDVETVADLTAPQFAVACRELEKKRGKK